MDCVGEIIPKCSKFCDSDIFATNVVEASPPVIDDGQVENNSGVIEEEV